MLRDLLACGDVWGGARKMKKGGEGGKTIGECWRMKGGYERRGGRKGKCLQRQGCSRSDANKSNSGNSSKMHLVKCFVGGFREVSR